MRHRCSGRGKCPAVSGTSPRVTIVIATMTPSRSRQLIAACGVAVLGFSACGSQAKVSSGASTTTVAVATSGQTSNRKPAVIVVGSTGSGGASAEAAPSVAGAGTDSKMMAMANITYVYDGTPPDLTAPAPSWYFAPGAPIDTKALDKVSSALGVAKDHVFVPDTTDSLPESDATANVTVSDDPMQSWYYNPTQSTEGYTVGCNVSGYTDGGIPADDGTADTTAPAGAPDTVVPDTVVPDTVVPDTVVPDTMPVDDCPAPQPPANVPTSDQAKTQATAFFAKVGVDLSNYDLEVYADEWSASVTAYLNLDGVRSDLSINVGFGGDGAITWANGFLATPQRGGDYDRIGVQAAVKRLSDQNMPWMEGGPVGSGGIWASARGGVSTDIAPEPAVAEAPSASTPGYVPPSDGTVVPGTAVVSPPASIVPDPSVRCLDNAAVDCAPLDTTPITVTLTDAKPSLQQLWAADGTVWLLPGYTFSSTDSGQYSVIAVPDQFIQQSTEAATTDVAPVDTSGGATTDTVVAGGTPNITVPAFPTTTTTPDSIPTMPTSGPGAPGPTVVPLTPAG